MIDITAFDAPAVDDPLEQARLLAKAEGELNDVLAEFNDDSTNITEA